MDTNMVKYCIDHDTVMGRYLKANVDLKAGEIIFRDFPVVVGPKMKSQLMCLSCHSPLSKKFRNCGKCKLAPLCSDKCDQKSGGWHSETECESFTNFEKALKLPKLLEETYLATILRCITLQNDQSKEKWDRFISLESHLDIRRETSIWKMHSNATEILYETNVLSSEDKKNDLAQKICGILDVNSFELRSNTDRQDGGSICGVYPLAALMAHSCISNVHLSINDNFEMIVRACVPIAKDSPIYFNYTNAMQGTINRREHLREGKYFNCSCDRCRDGTELGTHLSTVKCPKCNTATVIMDDPLKVDQYCNDAIWKCKSCGHKCKGDEIKNVLNELQERYENLDKSNPTALEKFLLSSLEKLHPNHYLMIEGKHFLAGLIRDITDRSIQQSKKLLSRKLEICKEFLPIIEVLEPGISRLKAITLYEIHIPTAVLADKDHDAREITNIQLLDKLNEARNCLKEAIKYLLFEPMNSPEGRLCRRAMDELKVLQKVIEDTMVMVEKEKDSNEKRGKKKGKSRK